MKSRMLNPPRLSTPTKPAALTPFPPPLLPPTWVGVTTTVGVTVAPTVGAGVGLSPIAIGCVAMSAGRYFPPPSFETTWRKKFPVMLGRFTVTVNAPLASAVNPAPSFGCRSAFPDWRSPGEKSGFNVTNASSCVWFEKYFLPLIWTGPPAKKPAGGVVPGVGVVGACASVIEGGLAASTLKLWPEGWASVTTDLSL